MEHGGLKYLTHRRRRDYLVDADYRVVLTLDPANAAPTIDRIAEALDRPARPLFLGRKPCLPTHPLRAGEVRGATVHEALDALARERPCPAAWPANEGPAGDRSLDVADTRIWSSGLHGGTRAVVEGRV